MVVYALAAISPRFLSQICACLISPTLYFFPSDLIGKLCVCAHFAHVCIHFVAPWFAYANRHVSCCCLCLRALLLTAGSRRATVLNVTVLTRFGPWFDLSSHLPPPEGNLVKSGLHLCCRKLQHMLPVLSAQPAQWLLPCLNEMRRRADTCNTSALITQRVLRPSASPGSTMQFTPKSCFFERLHKKVLMSSCATE